MNDLKTPDFGARLQMPAASRIYIDGFAHHMSGTYPSALERPVSPFCLFGKTAVSVAAIVQWGELSMGRAVSFAHACDRVSLNRFRFCVGAEVPKVLRPPPRFNALNSPLTRQPSM